MNPRKMPERRMSRRICRPPSQIQGTFTDPGGPKKKLLLPQIIESTDLRSKWTNDDITPEQLEAVRKEEARMHQHAREVAGEISADRLLEYAESTMHRPPVQGFSMTHVEAARIPLCGDQMSLLLRIVGDRRTSAKSPKDAFWN